jgi:hypothetical protein
MLAAYDPPETTMFYTGLVGSVLTAPALPIQVEASVGVCHRNGRAGAVSTEPTRPV